jgi:hypothetical protein
VLPAARRERLLIPAAETAKLTKLEKSSTPLQAGEANQ